MGRLRGLRGLALLGVGVASACGGRIAAEGVDLRDGGATAETRDDGPVKTDAAAPQDTTAAPQPGELSVDDVAIPIDTGAFDAAPTPTDAGASAAKQRLATGLSTCLLVEDGTIKCWGGNQVGQLGRGTIDSTATVVPAPVVGLPAKALEVAHRSDHACARLIDARVFCWGSGRDGLLGGGTSGDDAAVFYPSGTPVEIPGAKGALAIAVGGSHDCVLLPSGVKCWGSNSVGQLGDGTHTWRNSPQAVLGLSSAVVELSLGGAHSCARLVDGRVACWGFNYAGALAQPASITDSPVAAIVPGLADVVELSSAGHGTCARRSGGEVKCWGSVDGREAPRYEPTRNDALFGATQLSLGDIFSVARFPDGSARQWGTIIGPSVDAGLVTFDYLTTPVVAIPSGVVEVSAGWQHACARKGDGTVWCWGDGLDAVIGDALLRGEVLPAKIAL